MASAVGGGGGLGGGFLLAASGLPPPTRAAATDAADAADGGREQAPCLFSEVVSVRMKPAGRDEFLAELTVRLRPDSAAHPRSLLIELTDESDLFFYHSLVLGEGDFHTLKSEQRLLVDFQSFPGQLVELLRRCMDDASGAAVSGGLRMLACLECTCGGESIFSIVETNQFRELTYIALRLRQGTDETVKRYLAGKLQSYRLESTELAERLRTSEVSLASFRKQTEELSARARVVSEERVHLERSMDAAHQREVAELRQEHAREVAELQRVAGEERVRVEAELRRSLDDALARAERAERINSELQRQGEMLTASGKVESQRLEATDAQLRDARRELLEARELVKELELSKFQCEREIGEFKVQVSSLHGQAEVKGQLVANQAAQVEQTNAQLKGLEDSVAMYKQQAKVLEEKFALSAKEIEKGNQIIQKMSASAKQTRAKLRMKVSALSQQEKAALELQRADEASKHAVEEKDRELAHAQERNERCQQEVEDLKRKLSEALEVVKSNHDVIEYLNRQLTERDLKGLPSIIGAPAVDREVRNTPLNDLLNRAEGASCSLKGAGLGIGAAGLGVGAAGLGTSSVGLSSGALGGTMNVSGSGFGAAGLGGASTLAHAEAALGINARGGLSMASQSAISKGLAEGLGTPASGLVAGKIGHDGLRLQGPVAYRKPLAMDSLVSVK